MSVCTLHGLRCVVLLCRAKRPDRAGGASAVVEPTINTSRTWHSQLASPTAFKPRTNHNHPPTDRTCSSQFASRTASTPLSTACGSPVRLDCSALNVAVLHTTSRRSAGTLSPERGTQPHTATYTHSHNMENTHTAAAETDAEHDHTAHGDPHTTQLGQNSPHILNIASYGV